MTPLTAAEIAAIDARFDAGELVWMWCIHHGVRCEPLTERLSTRLAYVRKNKPAHEVSIRERWMQPVRDVASLPVWLTEVGRVYNEAWRVYNEAWRTYAPELAALHERECPGVPWGPNGLIFDGGAA